MPGAQKQGLVVFIWLGTGALLLVLLLHLLAASLVRSQLEALLHPQQGQGTYLGEIHLNLFTGLLSLQGLELRDAGQVQLQAAEVLVEIAPLALLDRRLHIRRAHLLGGRLQVHRRPDGAFLPPFPLPAVGTGSSDTPSFTLLSDHLALRRFTIDYRDLLTGRQEQLRIGQLEVQGPASAEQPQAHFLLSADWQSARVQAEGRLLIGASPEVSARLDLEQLPVGRALSAARVEGDLAALLGGQLEVLLAGQQLQLRGDLRAEGLVWQQGPQGLKVDRLAGKGVSLELDLRETPSLRLGLARLEAEALGWRDGESLLDLSQLQLAGGRLSLPPGEAPGWRLGGGALDLRDVDYRQPRGSLQLLRASSRGPWRVDLAGQALDLEGITLRLEQLQASRAQRQLQLGSAKLELSAEKASLANPALEGRLWLSRLQLRSPELQGDVFSLQEGKIGRWQLENAAVRLSDLSAGPLGMKDFPLELERLRLDRARLADRDARLGQLRLSGLRGELRRDPGGEWQIPFVRPKGETTTPVATGGPEFSLEGLRLEGESRLRWVDAGIEPPIDLGLSIAELELGVTDSRAKDRDTPFRLAIAPDKYSGLKLAGQVRPFAEPLYLKLEGELDGLELAQINGLVSNDLGHRFLSGQMDNRFDLLIEQQQLTMQNTLQLQDLDVQAIEGKDGPPLQTAVALLEDRNGRFELQVPVQGDLGNPDFRVLAALNPVILKAVAGAAALSVQPLGSVLVIGGLLASEALKVSFDPVLFEPGGVQLRDAGKLDQLAGKLKEKPKLELRLCGVVVQVDRSRDKKGGLVETGEKLLGLAEQRAQRVRELMLAGGVAEAQLKSCRPVYDQADAGLPRVEIKL